jgi:GNAT superfamily N-acetyltransferase
MAQVRIALRADAPFIVQSQLAMALETEALTLDLDTVRAGVNAVFDTPTRGFYLLAERDAAPAACMLVLSEWSDWRNRDVWWLHSVYVLPEQRRAGVFRALHGEIVRLARERGVAGLRLYVDRRNTRAQAVYRELGMTDEHYQLYEQMF